MKQIVYFSYILFLILFAIFSFAFIDPNLFYLKSLYSGIYLKNRELVTGIYISSLIIFFAYYIFFLLDKKNLNLQKVISLIIPSIVILLFAYPAIVSYDIFNYIASSKILFLYKENPYIVMPIDITHEPLLAFMHAANKTALYGFVWIIFTGIPFFLGFYNFVLTLFTFKFFVICFYIVSIYIIWKLSKNISSILLFALNPLVLLQTVVSGHNDIVMMFLVLTSFLAMKNKKIALALFLFMLSIFIKYATIMLLPLFIYFIFSKNKNINWEKVYLWSAGLMFTIFLLSQLREEIYPWYAVWFMPFIFLQNKKWLIILTIALSFGLLLRDVPFMLLGTYFGPTPMLKVIVTISIPLITLIALLAPKIWSKKFYLK
ncbi:MAG TPA: hypothetical protein VF820_03615 [Patescibacteria group bacterium]